MSKKWIQKADIKKGALHRALGIPEGENIPKDELLKAKSKGGHLGKMASLAMTFAKMHHKGKRKHHKGG